MQWPTGAQEAAALHDAPLENDMGGLRVWSLTFLVMGPLSGHL